MNHATEHAEAGSPRCHLCGRALSSPWATAWDIEYASVPDSFDYFLCEVCDALSIHPLPEDRLAEIYPPTYYSFAGSDSRLGRPGLVTRVKESLDARRFRRVIEPISSEEIRLLDVGGGSGYVLRRLLAVAGRPGRGTVVDIDPESIEEARGAGLDGFVGRFEDFASEERFHVILMLNLIEHVASPHDVLAKARALLAPGGILWIQTPNFRALDARVFRNRSWAGLHCPRHWVVFSHGGLSRALDRAGLRPTRLEHTQAGSFWAASLLGARDRVPPATRAAEPLVASRAYVPLAALGAAFDFATRPVRATSQLVALATPDEG